MTLGGIEQQIPAYLARHGIAGSPARVVALVVDAERRGIASVRVRASVPAGAGLPGARGPDRPRRRPPARAGRAHAELRGGRGHRSSRSSPAGRQQGEAAVQTLRAERAHPHPARGPGRVCARAECGRRRRAAARPGQAVRPHDGLQHRRLVRRRVPGPDSRSHRDQHHHRRRVRRDRRGAHRRAARARDHRDEPADHQARQQGQGARRRGQPHPRRPGEHAGPATREDREDPPRRPATGRGRSPRRAARVRQRHRHRRGGRGRGRHARGQQLPGPAGSVPVGRGARRA